MMDRREFLKAAGMASLCYMLPEFQAWAAQGNANYNGNKLVVVFLRGAIDGLSVVVPHSDDAYYQYRPKIAIPRPGVEGGALALNNDFSLHPSLSALMPFWENKTMAFVQNSGSPDPTRSHFDAQDYMESGAPGNKTMSTGWLNRLLEALPNNQSPVRAINLGATTPRILQGPVASASYAPNQSRGRSPIDRKGIADEFMEMYGGRKDEMEKTFLEGLQARHTIDSALAEGSSQEMMQANQGAVPVNRFGSFGKQLGKLIHEEPSVQVSFVALGGFDTHVNQGNSKGQLAGKLNTLGTGLAQLVEALGDSYNKTMILVVSEFGRTAKENGNGGTDHGHGNTMWLLGGKVNGGKMYGRWNGMSSRELYEGRDLPVSTDFRSVIGSAIGEHMQLSQAQLATIFPSFQIGDKAVSSIIK